MHPAVAKIVVPIAVLAALVAQEARAVIALDGATAGNFTMLMLGGPSDPVADNQANRVDLELVGRPENSLEAFYIKFDDFGTPSTTDGEMAFRFRLSGNKGQGTIGGNVYVGLDLTGDGALDYFITHEGKNDQNIAIIRAGGGANNSPASITLGDTLFTTDANSDNVNFSSVSSIDHGLVGDGYDPYDLDTLPGTKSKSGEDYFLTFKIDFSILVGLVRTDAANGRIDSKYVLFDQTTALQMITVTSQNTNNINSDFGGIDDSTRDPTIPFNDPQQPGGSTVPIDSTGTPVPEPGAYALLLGLAAVGFRFWVRK